MQDPAGGAVIRLRYACELTTAGTLANQPTRTNNKGTALFTLRPGKGGPIRVRDLRARRGELVVNEAAHHNKPTYLDHPRMGSSIST